MSDLASAEKFHHKHQQIQAEIAKVIVGQSEAVDGVLTALFCNSHALLVGVPGLAKTKLIQSIAQALDLSFKRIQFTPDLMPSDIVGTEILDSNKQFIFNQGPIFANLILADEINRTPPKTQSALLEAMQEKVITVSVHPYKLPNPFFVMATQNPIEQEGTYPLPEAQLDRFMYSILLDYPKFSEEIEIVKSTTIENEAAIQPVLNAAEILEIHQLVRKIPVTDNVYEYAIGLVTRTRPNSPLASEIAKKYIAWGAGPRASQYLILAAKCIAMCKGKYSPDIEDVQQAALPVLNHRIFKNYQAEADEYTTEMIIKNIL